MSMVQPVLNKLVARYPWPFKKALMNAHPTMFGENIGRWDQASYEHFHPIGPFQGFEDIVTLFSVGRFNRGVIRLDLDEAALLYRTVKAMKDPVGVEIGRGWGGSTLLLAIAGGERSKVYSIQLEPTHDGELLGVAAKGGVGDRIELLVGDCRTVPFSQTVDYAFIDGAREYDLAKHDHLRYGSLVKPGGFVLHHDTTDARPGATTAPEMLRLRDEIFEHHRGYAEVYDQAGSLLVLRKLGTEWPSF